MTTLYDAATYGTAFIARMKLLANMAEPANVSRYDQPKFGRRALFLLGIAPFGVAKPYAVSLQDSLDSVAAQDALDAATAGASYADVVRAWGRQVSVDGKLRDWGRWASVASATQWLKARAEAARTLLQSESEPDVVHGLRQLWALQGNAVSIEDARRSYALGSGLSRADADALATPKKGFSSMNIIPQDVARMPLSFSLSVLPALQHMKQTVNVARTVAKTGALKKPTGTSDPAYGADVYYTEAGGVPEAPTARTTQVAIGAGIGALLLAAGVGLLTKSATGAAAGAAAGAAVGAGIGYAVA